MRLPVHTDVDMRDNVRPRGGQAPFCRPGRHRGLHRHSAAMRHLINSHIVLECHTHSIKLLSRHSEVLPYL